MIKKRLAIFASGSGTNALKLVDYFTNHPYIEIGILICNKKDAPVVQAFEKIGLTAFILDNQKASQGKLLLNICKNQGVDFVVLAGYLRKIPDELIAKYPEQIINIHPALLPKFGGNGMYGMRVHEAVKAEREKFSGISIHLVNANYDDGQMIAQFYCNLSENDTVIDISKKVQRLEHTFYPIVVENYINLF